MLTGPDNTPGRNAFSLMEIVVAVAILFILIVLVASILQSAASAINASNWRRESVAAARTVFNRLKADVASMIRREDVSYGFSEPGGLTDYIGNDRLAFFTSGSAFGGDRGIIQAAYRINSNHAMERAASPANWSQTPAFFLPSGETGKVRNYLPVVANTDWQTLCPEIVRFEICFRVREGDQVLLQPNPPDRIGALTSIVAAVAALDTSAREILSSSQLASTAAALADPAQDEHPATIWGDALKKDDFSNTAGIPPLVSARIRCYEQTIPLP